MLHPPGQRAKVQETTELGNLLPRPCSYLFLLGTKHESGGPSDAQSCRSAQERQALASCLGRSLLLGQSHAAEISRTSSESCLSGTAFPTLPPESDLWVSKGLCPLVECKNEGLSTQQWLEESLGRLYDNRQHLLST